MAANPEIPENLFLTPTDSRGHVPEKIRDACMRRYRAKPENRMCFDCPNRNPTWMSITYGIWLCLNCSGKHRRMGVHITFVRSSDLDMFTPEQLIRMDLGGNAAAQEFFRCHGVSGPPDYSSKLAERYRAQLDVKVAEVKSLQRPDANSKCLSTTAVEPVETVAAAVPVLTGPPTSSFVEATPEKFLPSSTASSPPMPTTAKQSLTFVSAPASEKLRARKLAEDVDFDKLFASAKTLQ